MLKNRRNGDDSEEMSGGNNQNKFITIMESNGRVEVYLRGMFGDPIDSTKELIALQKLSEEFDTVVLWINSPGGNVALLVEIMNICKNFNNIITIGSGQIASAGCMLWSIGDVRVLMPHTDIMIHRESYFGGYSKTEEHLEHAKHTDRLYKRLMDELFTDILESHEIERAKLTEVYLTPEDMFDRNVAISYEQYLEYDSIEVTAKHLIVMSGYTFIDNQDGTMTMVDDIELGATAKTSEIQYILLNELQEIEDFEDLSEEEQEEILKKEKGE